jgi:hypothetical protein
MHIFSFRALTLALRSSRRQRNLGPLPPPSLDQNVAQAINVLHAPSHSVHPTSDSSDDDSFTMTTVPHNSSIQNMATIKFHDAHKTAPILTAGTVSPAILTQLIQYFTSYFHKCKIPDEDKVR